jgi:hypothetical protein
MGVAGIVHIRILDLIILMYIPHLSIISTPPPAFNTNHLKPKRKESEEKGEEQ